METHILFILGWSASALVIISLFMKSMMKMRWISLCGGLIYAVYGLLFGSMPLFCYNILRAMVNVHFLRKLYARKELFELLHIPPDNSYLRYFLDAYKKDIIKFNPSFNPTLREDSYCLFALRNAEVVGTVIANPGNDGEICVDLDYVIPKYRDMKSARFIMEKYACAIKRMASHGFRYLSAKGESPEQAKYLIELGYEAAEDNVHYRMSAETIEARYLKNVY